MTEETRENEAATAPNEPESSESGATTSANAEPAVKAESTSTESASTEAASTEAAPTESASTESASTEAASTEAAPTESASTEAASTEAASTEAASTEAASAESASTESSAETEAETEAGTSEAEGGETAATAEGAEDGKKKKRKRRKKKKKKPEGDKKPQPFTHLFEGASRQHAFRAGEVVAGRVARVADGVIVVDLFGKATAIVDEHEPREVPEPVAEPAVETSAGETEAPTTAGEAVDAVIESVGEVVQAAAEVAKDAAEAVVEVVGEAAAAAAEFVGEAADAIAEAVGSEERVSEEPAEAAPEAAPEASEAETVPEAGTAPEAQAAEAETAAEPTEASDATEQAAEELQPPPPPPAVGSIFRGRVGGVAESGHIILVNRNIDRPAAKARIAALREQRTRVHGVVYGYNRGGFDVLVEGIRAFCPAAGMALAPIQDPASCVGQKLEFTLPVNRGSGKSIIVSRRGILERELRKKARARLKELEVGQRLEGPVTEIRDYGLLVDLGEGLEGLVHQSEVSWTRGQRPSDAASVGDVVQVEVLKVQPASRKDRQGRVSLSMRRCLADPWDEHAETLKAGTMHQGKVVSTTEFGAFLELVPGIEGLLHISELGGRDLKHAKQAVSQGDVIEVLVERVDKKERRISLSKLTPEDKKAIESGEWDPAVAPRSLKPGAYVTIVIQRIEHHGVLATVKGVLGKRGRAYIPNRELTIEGASRKKAYAQGVELEVKIIGKDREGQLRCSLKARLIDEERRAVKDYRKEASKQGFGTFGDLLKAKLGDGSKN
ncbi:MAG: S1 RNA-binding domain-containing protein [Myxococcota bacterium]